MTTETITAPDYHRPDVEVKLEILKARHGYSEARGAALHGKPMTLAVVRNGELQVAEGTLKPGFGGRARFFAKGCRTASEAWDVTGIIGHTGGYGNGASITGGALRALEAITGDDIRAHLAARELRAQEEASSQAAREIARICRDVQTLQTERQADDARILALLDAGAPALAQAA